MSFEEIKTIGTTDSEYSRTGVSNTVRCADGFKMSVIAGGGAYCSPRPEWNSGEGGPYTAVEVGFPSERPEPWADWEQYCENPDDPTETFYGYVPVVVVEALVALHGGEVA